MKGLIKFIVPALALGMFAVVPAQRAVADDAPATQPAAKAEGSVSIRVVDGQGNPVEGATVQIVPEAAKGKGKAKKNDPTAVKEKPVAVASGKTDVNGLVTLSNIPEGSYRANAKLKGGGGETGHEEVIVAATAGPAAAVAAPPVTITVKAKKNAAPTSQPA